MIKILRGNKINVLYLHCISLVTFLQKVENVRRSVKKMGYAAICSLAKSSIYS